MVLAAIVNLFDGEELLEGAITQIRKHVDEVIVIWQEISNYTYEKHEISEFVYSLKEKGLIDVAIRYEPHRELSARNNELNKRRMGFKIAATLGCSHFLFLDTDEYYDEQEFRRAKEVTDSGDYMSTFCSIYTYYKEPIYRLKDPEGMLVPFICKITDSTVIGTNDLGTHVVTYPYSVDPTRATLVIGKHWVFSTEDIAMHHFSLVRKEIGRKLRNSSARNDFGHYKHSVEELVKRWEEFSYEEGKMIFYEPPHVLVKVPNRFDIRI